ncbi:hypothetical protein BCV69DRAFT_192113 [Microstroma glucosiphilum]|uniref:Uncharacterized protein n=1 Tax=Pseudomicrostroma glucosiphilum TaxID=1684307 RepID=A0A316U5R4_9BASI|nr:hypothetical protein BCV69DRAFT_192113 [Pseudomicrostroma glucosiphilum]PWN20552.1 hypothetical protein BCV69DRAFT_192113 [Pseudomicrostroma glucosiphilum]
MRCDALLCSLCSSRAMGSIHSGSAPFSKCPLHSLAKQSSPVTHSLTQSINQTAKIVNLGKRTYCITIHWLRKPEAGKGRKSGFGANTKITILGSKRTERLGGTRAKEKKKT